MDEMQTFQKYSKYMFCVALMKHLDVTMFLIVMNIRKKIFPVLVNVICTYLLLKVTVCPEHLHAVN